MNIRDIPRTMVRTTLRAWRLPLDAVGAATGRERTTWAPAIAFDGAQATVKQLVGRALRDEQLVHEAELQRAEVAQLRRAIELEATAEATRRQADRQLEARRESAEERRRRVEQQAAKEAEAAERRRTTAKKQVRKKAAAREEAVEKVSEAREQMVEKDERAARAAELEAERAALQEQRSVVEATATAELLDDAIENSKAARNSS